MKVKVTKEAWYNKKRLKPGDVIDFTGGKLPSWAKAIKQPARTVEVPQTSNLEIVPVPIVQSIPEEKKLGGETKNNPYAEKNYQELLKITKEKGLKFEKSPKRADLENALIADDLKPAKSEEDLMLEKMTDDEIIALAKKNFDCVLDKNEPDLILSYKNAEKTFQKKD